MKYFSKWRGAFFGVLAATGAAVLVLLFSSDVPGAVFLIITAALFSFVFFGLWYAIKAKGVQTELDISRVLGRDAKDALSFGDVGILTYNDEFVCTWTSDFFKERKIDLVNRKLTTWIESIRDLFDENVDVITASDGADIYEITRKEDGQLLYVKDVTELTRLKDRYKNSQPVVGLLQLDNYMEYQSYENEDIMAAINTQLRSPLITWAKENDMFVRRIRSDRIFVLCSEKTLQEVRSKNLSILQEIKDKARAMDVSITLSMAFAYGTKDYAELDTMLNELIELAQSRGGDQCALQRAGHKVHYIGGNSESSSQRSKVRVRIMAQTIQDAMLDSDHIYIAGHVNSDYDCVGACLSLSNWATTLGKKAYIVLEGVPRDHQLQLTMDQYDAAMEERHNFITPEQAKAQMDPVKDLLILADHAVPEISTAQSFLDDAQRIAVIDHHRRSESFVDHPMITYIESKSSSTCELIVELLQNIPRHVPIFEAEATIMYLGLLVDTNRFKMHTSSRTFETAAVLRDWGANTHEAERALLEDPDEFQKKARLVSAARPFMEDCMITIEQQPVSRTLLSQVSDSLLKIRGVRAAFAVAPDAADPETICISARSDGTVNVQMIMEKLQGGGHFSAAAAQKKGVTAPEFAAMLEKAVKEVRTEYESDPAEGR